MRVVFKCSECETGPCYCEASNPAITPAMFQRSRSEKLKLHGQQDKILACLSAGFSKVKVAKKLGVTRTTLDKFIKERRWEENVVEEVAQ